MDSRIRQRFNVFCSVFLDVQPQSEEEKEQLYQVFKYAYLVGRKDLTEEKDNENVH